MNARLKKELIKNSYEQPLHFLMTLASVLLFSWLFKGDVIVAVVLTVFWVGYREYRQLPTDRIWDPILDATFEVAGVVAGYFIWIKFIN